MVSAVDNRAKHGQRKHQGKGKTSQHFDFFDRVLAHENVKSKGQNQSQSDHRNNSKCLIVIHKKTLIFMPY